MPHFFTVIWEDFEGAQLRSNFWSDTQGDAEGIVEDLLGVSDAKWAEFREGTTTIVPASPLFGQPAAENSTIKVRCELKMQSEVSRAAHRLTVPCVKASYVSPAIPVSLANPFQDLARFKSAEGEPYAHFVRAKYQYRNR